VPPPLGGGAAHDGLPNSKILELTPLGFKGAVFAAVSGVVFDAENWSAESAVLAAVAGSVVVATDGALSAVLAATSLSE
jgi:hypothetical protein